jgi:hypothetical protein
VRSLVEANDAVLKLLYRAQVDSNEVTGEQYPNVTLIDFESPERNHFVAINQFRVDTPGAGKGFIIPDLVLFVNGIPLVVKPWPLKIKTGDYCLLHHYEIGGLLALWQATSHGGRGLESKMWGGKFPFQVRVKLVLPKITEVPQEFLAELGVNPAVGRFENCVDEDFADELVKGLLEM